MINYDLSKLLFINKLKINKLLLENVPVKLLNLLSTYKLSSQLKNLQKKTLFYNKDCYKSIKTAPQINKKICFKDNHISTLVKDPTFKKLKTLFSSSGASGEFSYASESFDEKKSQGIMNDFFFDYFFNSFQKKTLIINALSQGVSINTRFTPISETSVRSDIVLEHFKKSFGLFEQYILIAEPLFLKKILEDGIKSCFDFSKYNIHVISGGNYIPVGLCRYVRNILGHSFTNPEKGIFLTNFGVSELATTIGFETRQTSELRFEVAKNSLLRKRLLGIKDIVVPKIMHYNPLDILVEESSLNSFQSHLVFSNLSLRKNISLIRYKTEDLGKLIDMNIFKMILKDFSLYHLMPVIKFPLFLLWGRDKILRTENGTTTINEIKEIMFENDEFSSYQTGDFKILDENNFREIIIQRSEYSEKKIPIEDSFTDLFKKKISPEIKISFAGFKDYGYNLIQDFEQKPNHFL